MRYFFRTLYNGILHAVNRVWERWRAWRAQRATRAFERVTAAYYERIYAQENTLDTLRETLLQQLRDERDQLEQGLRSLQTRYQSFQQEAEIPFSAYPWSILTQDTVEQCLHNKIKLFSVRAEIVEQQITCVRTLQNPIFWCVEYLQAAYVLSVPVKWSDCLRPFTAMRRFLALPGFLREEPAKKRALCGLTQRSSYRRILQAEKRYVQLQKRFHQLHGQYPHRLGYKAHLNCLIEAESAKKSHWAPLWNAKKKSLDPERRFWVVHKSDSSKSYVFSALG